MASFDALTSYMTRCMGRGLAVSAAIAMHNIPGTCSSSCQGSPSVLTTMKLASVRVSEGMAVAMPIYASTGSKWQAMKWCLLSSICEPAAAVLFGFAFNQYLTRSIMSALNAVGTTDFCAGRSDPTSEQLICVRLVARAQWLAS